MSFSWSNLEKPRCREIKCSSTTTAITSFCSNKFGRASQASYLMPCCSGGTSRKLSKIPSCSICQTGISTDSRPIVAAPGMYNGTRSSAKCFWQKRLLVFPNSPKNFQPWQDMLSGNTSLSNLALEPSATCFISPASTEDWMPDFGM